MMTVAPDKTISVSLDVSPRIVLLADSQTEHNGTLTGTGRLTTIAGDADVIFLFDFQDVCDTLKKIVQNYKLEKM